MEGGIAILLLLIVLVVGGGVALVMYLTGGTLLARKGDPLDAQPEPVEERNIPPERVVGADDDDAKRAARRAERAARRSGHDAA